MVLAVEDDGIGLPADSSHRKGLGLRIMSYRTHRMGGNLELSPRPGGGTLVDLRRALGRRAQLNFRERLQK